jgi:putative transposase
VGFLSKLLPFGKLVARHKSSFVRERKIVSVSPSPIRYHDSGKSHFITFSCHQRRQLLSSPNSRRIFELTLERTRKWYGIYIAGYVVMPEHVHLLVSEPERKSLSVALQMLKQTVARQLRTPGGADRFWQPRYYDFDVWSTKKHVEKLRYIHRNPVERGLVARPEDWEWSSFRHYATGLEGVVEIESEWTARKRERFGAPSKLILRSLGS